jgi:hypothetical protein
VAAAVKRALVVALIALAAATCAAARAAVPPTTWIRVSGPFHAGTQLGLAREGTTLHVISAQGDPATITDTMLGKDGHANGSATVATGFDGTGGLALLPMPGGSLRLLAAGGSAPGLGSHAVGINSFIRPFGSATWSLDPTVYGGAVANAADELGATIAGNGWVYTTWSGAIVHIGFLPSDGDRSYQPDCCGADPQVVSDRTGAVFLAWISNGHFAGTFVREIWPSESSVFALPSGTTSGSFGLAAPFGFSDGAYVAYVDQAKQKVQLYKYLGGIETLATGSFQVVKVFRALGGRLWVMWGSGGGGIWVTRSNMAITKFEPIRHLTLPPATNGFYNAEGEGSPGQLDLFADVLTGRTDRGFWRTHVLPTATLTMRKTYENLVDPHNLKHPTDLRVTITLADAGDPLPFVHLILVGDGQQRFVTTNKQGRAELTVYLGGKPLAHPLGLIAKVPGYTIETQTRGA